MKKPAFSLSKKAILAVVVILLPLLVTFAISYKRSSDTYRKHILDDLIVLAESVEGQLFQFLDSARSRTEDFATDGLIMDNVERYARGDKRAADRLNAHLDINKLPLERHIKTISIISMEGRIISSTRKSIIGMDVSKEPFFLEGIKGAAVTEGPLFFGAPRIIFSSPIKGIRSGDTIGAIVNSYPLTMIEKIFTGEAKRDLGAVSWSQKKLNTLEAYIVNRDRLMLTGSRFVKNAILSQKVDTPPVQACLGNGEEISGFYKDYRGVEVAGASMCIPKLSWTLIVEVDSSEAVFPLSSIRKDAIYAGIIVFLLILILYMVFYRTVILRLMGISGAAELMAGGDYNIYLPEKGNDEIGMLARSFNSMVSDIKYRDNAILASEEKYRSLIYNIPDVTWTSTEQGNTLFISPNIESVYGYTQEEVYSDPSLWLGRVHPDDLEGVLNAFKELFASGKTFDVEYRIKRKDGQWIWLHDRATHAYEKDGVRLADGVFSDITAKKLAQEALKSSEEKLKLAQHVASLGSWDWDIVKNHLSWSDEIYRIFGLEPQEFGATYESFIKSVHPEDREFVKQSVYDSLYEQKPYSIDHRIVLPGNEVRFVHEQGEVAFDEKGRPVRMIGTVQDITERKNIEFELKKLSMAIEQSVNIVFITDYKGAIQYVNPVFEKITGYSKEDAIGQTPRILSSGELPNQIYEELWKTVLSGKTWRSMLKNKKKSGGFYWCNSIISPIKDDRGEITHFLAVQEDITEKMLSEERLNYLAAFDELTGLFNRTKFIEQLESIIVRNGITSGALLLIDMDQFKFLNDTFGHAIGDDYLRRLGRFLKGVVQKIGKDMAPDAEPLLGKLSGDEFAIFFPTLDKAGGFEAAEKIRKTIEAFRFAEVNTSLTVSIGIAVYPEHGKNAGVLFTKADAAVYRAKELGRNRCHVYNIEDKDLEKMHSRLAWRERIMAAFKEDRFEPFFQPILDLRDSGVHHYEVLARMRDEQGGILLPGAFIDIAERFGLIGGIDRVIIEKAMRKQAELKAQGRNLSFAMNLSGKDLVDESLLTFIRSKINETGADPNSLIFEITETAAISDLERARQFVKSLKETGCHFSLDDFGVGFTSFIYLKELKVDFIKIDGSFVRKLNENPDDQVFVRALTEVARGLKIKTIAEFVETEEVLRLLKRLGADYAQGYLIGKPAPIIEERVAEFTVRMQARKEGKGRV